jgi:ribosomal protein S18 acetylase RimI-like enzyme
MLHATPELARRIDRAEIDFCALTTTRGAPLSATLERGGGCAVYGGPGSPVNKVLGLGLGVDVTDEDLDAIEAFYGERGCPVQIELCPLTTVDLPARLTRRGYVLQAFENELARLTPATDVSAPFATNVNVEAGADEGPWLRVVSEGFAVSDWDMPGRPPSRDTAAAIAEVMRQFLHPEVVRYVAWVDGQPAAAGLSLVNDRVLGIFGTATLPQFRRRGLQGAIVARAMNDARERADLVMATTEPGSISQRTFERLGFQVIYTRAILVKY